MDYRHIIGSLPAIIYVLIIIIIISRPVVSVLYAQSLNLDFLCSTSESNAYVRDIPWDCSSYIICMDGQAIPTECPQGKVYDGGARNSKCVPSHRANARRCHRKMWDYINSICRANPGAKLPDPEGCSHFFDCTVINGGQDLMNYLVECPYPSLFSKQTGGCRDFRLVYCGERKEPKAPCEYLQYMQMYDCTGPNCVSCSSRHPSCVGRLNGPQFVPNRNDFMMECSNERTVNIIPSNPSSSSSSSSTSTSSTSSSSASSLPLPAVPSPSSSTAVAQPPSPSASSSVSAVSSRAPSASSRAPSVSSRAPSASSRATPASSKAPSASFRAPSASSRAPSASSGAPSASSRALSASSRTPSSGVSPTESTDIH